MTLKDYLSMTFAFGQCILFILMVASGNDPLIEWGESRSDGEQETFDDGLRPLNDSILLHLKKGR